MAERAHMKQPCENCPYRTDSPRALWHPSEFENLLRSDVDHMGKIFNCHKQAVLPAEERGFCAGWLLDQVSRGVPSIALRLALCTDSASLAAAKAVSGAGLQLFPDVDSMCLANGISRRRIRELRQLKCTVCGEPAKNGPRGLCSACWNRLRKGSRH